MMNHHNIFSKLLLIWHRSLLSIKVYFNLFNSLTNLQKRKENKRSCPICDMNIGSTTINLKILHNYKNIMQKCISFPTILLIHRYRCLSNLYGENYDLVFAIHSTIVDFSMFYHCSSILEEITVYVSLSFFEVERKGYQRLKK